MNEATENKGFIYEFGKFVLDPQERVLLVDGKSVHLTDKVLDTLLLLIESNGRLLIKDEMIILISPNSFDEIHSIAVLSFQPQEQRVVSKTNIHDIETKMGVYWHPADCDFFSLLPD